MKVIICFDGKELEEIEVDSLVELPDLPGYDIIIPEDEQMFTHDLEKLTTENNYYRRVIKTGSKQQFVLMSLEPGQEIGEEVHNVDQFIRVEEGEADAIIDGNVYKLYSDSAITVNAGQHHNVVNVGKKPLKIYNIYSPPEHPKGLIQITKS